MNKDIAQDEHAKIQKKIRELSKKRREKAILVDHKFSLILFTGLCLGTMTCGEE